jgi:hypothetical protein
MRRFAIVILCTLACGLAAAPATVAHPPYGPKAACNLEQAQLIAADRQAQVYEVTGSPFYLGCAYGHRGAYPLGAGPKCGGGGPCRGTREWTMAGTMVAYERYLNSAGTGTARDVVIVRNLDGGRIVHKLASGTPKPANAPFHAVGAGPVVGLVVKPDGAVAWIDEAPRTSGEYEVHAVDATGSRILASGKDIDPASLALSGSALYWTQNGQPASAVLH